MKKALLFRLLSAMCVVIGLLLLISTSPSCSNTSDDSEDVIDDDYTEIDVIEDIMHNDIQAEEVQAEDIETEPTGGTWTDSSSGLTWQNPPAESAMQWPEAVDYCENLILDGHSDWRLPTISELRSLIRGCPATQTGWSCGVDDGCLSFSSCWSDPCEGCSSGGPDDGCYRPVEVEGSCDWYWSSSSREDDDFYRWFVIFFSGRVDHGVKALGNDVRCVR